MIKVAGIDHIVLRTSRLSEMLAFYSEVLGCKVERETDPELGLTQLRAGNALIDLVDIDSELGRAGGGAPGGSENNLDHFCLQLEPISEPALKTWLGEQGIDVGEFDTRYGAEGFGPSVYITDPEGNVVELRSRRT